METITLNDGTVVNGHAFETDTALLVYVYDTPMLDGLLLFSDPEKTRRMVELNHGVEHIYSGYTQITAASAEYGNCNIVMRRGGNA